MKNYVPYHMHTTYSVIDSTTQPEDYIAKCKELGIKALAFSEHGNCFNWIKKKQLCDKAGLKYIHAIELYMTRSLEEKVRDNYHVILIAKNWEGVMEINELYSIATQIDHMYYNPRITFEEFFNISDNVITTSACLGGVLNKISRDDPYFDRFVERFDFLEIQHHNDPDQIRYNKMLAEIAPDKLIAGTDTHEISDYKAECRKIWMTGKGKVYDGEENFDLVFKSYEELVNAYKVQSSLPETTYLEAIERTNTLIDLVEDFELDYTFKYPDIYENATELLKKSAYDSFYKMYSDGLILDSLYDKYVERLDEELRIFIKLGMESFMLFMSELMNWCDENGIKAGYARGSAGGSLVAYMLGIIDVDPIIWNTVFSRFVNENRISLGDIDSDFSPADRKKIFQYIRNRFTDSKSAHITTFQKLSFKTIIDDVGRALNLDLDEVHRIKKGYEKLDKAIKFLDRKHEEGEIDDDEYESKMDELQTATDEYVSRFDNIFYYYNGLKGSIASVGFHPCGFIGSPINIRTTIGLRYDKDKDIWISQCDMKNVDSLNYVKYDILSLATLQIVRDSYRLCGEEMPKSANINWNDEAVFNDMLTSPIGLFQMESKSTFEYLVKFMPKSVKDITLLTAIIRPSCASFRDNVMTREFHYNPDERIDNVLSDSYGYLVYQEQQISFLQKICGFSEGMADVVRRAIGKKDKALLDEWLPKIEAGYIANSPKDEATAKKECEEFMQIFIDSASYSFGFNHATAYSMMTYMTAYQRYYHPIEFITAYLNNSKGDDDIANGTTLAKLKGIKINNPKFGKSIGEYSIQDGQIYKGIGSVLNVSNQCANELMNLYNQKYSHNKGTFFELMKDALALKGVDSRKLETLIKIDFFSDYGKAKKLLKFFELIKKYSGRKQLSKEGLPKGTHTLICKLLDTKAFGFSETNKQFKINADTLLEEMWKYIKDVDFEPEEKIVNQLSYLSYIQDEELLTYKVGTVAFYSPKNNSYCICFVNGKEVWYKLNEGLTRLNKGDIINIVHEINVKNGRYTNKQIEIYNKLELDRKKK